MKYTDVYREFLEDSIYEYVKVITKVGTVHQGFLQAYSDQGVIVSDDTTSFIDLKDIAVIELTNCSLSDYWS